MRGLRTCGPGVRLTLVGRALALLGFEVLFNVVCWIAAGLCFSQAGGLLGLAMLAWTLGLRHGLDADHISAIDNATRQMVSLGRLPLTCGLWFSLGHSTIVIAVNVAIAISVDIYSKLDPVGTVGGLIGTAVSASFLFLVAVINSYFLYDALKHRRARKERERLGLPPAEDEMKAVHGGGCLVRIIGPILKAVDRPWKLYPVGILFGFGFDTASSIALLALSAIASRGPHGESISHGKIVVLPFLFTAGMSLVDSLDSILMLYAYAEPELKVDGKWRVVEKRHLEERVIQGEGRDVVGGEVDSRSMVGAGVERADGEREPAVRAGEETAVVAIESAGAIGAPGATEGSRHIETELEIALAATSPPPGTDTDTKDTKPAALKDASDSSALSYLPPNAESPPSYSQHPESSPSSCHPADQPHPDAHLLASKTATISTLSISLTLLSIAVALSISLIEIMGLIGEHCTQCREAAEDPEGLAGRWWRAWAAANDASGYVGAAIVGCFVAILVIYHGVRWGVGRYRRREQGIQV